MVRRRKLRSRVSTTFRSLHPYCSLYHWRVPTLLGLRLSYRPPWRLGPGSISDALGDSLGVGVLTTYASLFTGKKEPVEWRFVGGTISCPRNDIGSTVNTAISNGGRKEPWKTLPQGTTVGLRRRNCVPRHDMYYEHTDGWH